MTVTIKKIVCDKCSCTEWDTKGRDYYCRNCGTKMSDEKIQRELKTAYREAKQENEELKEKLEIINSIHEKVVEYECYDDICHYVYVPADDVEVLGVLRKLGKDDAWINDNVLYREDDEVIDITHVGFEFASWWSNDTGFCIQ